MQKKILIILFSFVLIPYASSQEDEAPRYTVVYEEKAEKSTQETIQPQVEEAEIESPRVLKLRKAYEKAKNPEIKARLKKRIEQVKYAEKNPPKRHVKPTPYENTTYYKNTAAKKKYQPQQPNKKHRSYNSQKKHKFQKSASSIHRTAVQDRLKRNMRMRHFNSRAPGYRKGS